MYAQFAQDLRTYTVVALIGQMTQVDVGVNRVHAIFLQLVGFDFIHQADTSTLLVEIDYHALAGLVNHLHRFVELFTTVAAHRTEDVAGSA